MQWLTHGLRKAFFLGEEEIKLASCKTLAPTLLVEAEVWARASTARRTAHAVLAQRSSRCALTEVHETGARILPGTSKG